MMAVLLGGAHGLTLPGSFDDTGRPARADPRPDSRPQTSGPGRLAIAHVSARGLAGCGVGLQPLEEPLPPFPVIRVVAFDTLSLDPATQATPRAPHPAADHPVEEILVDDALVDHRAPGLAGAADRGHRVEQSFVAADPLGLDVLWQLQDLHDRAVHVAGLDCAHDVDRGGVPTFPDGSPDLRDAE